MAKHLNVLKQDCLVSILFVSCSLNLWFWHVFHWLCQVVAQWLRGFCMTCRTQTKAGTQVARRTAESHHWQRPRERITYPQPLVSDWVHFVLALAPFELSCKEKVTTLLLKRTKKRGWGPRWLFFRFHHMFKWELVHRACIDSPNPRRSYRDRNGM